MASDYSVTASASSSAGLLGGDPAIVESQMCLLGSWYRDPVQPRGLSHCQGLWMALPGEEGTGNFLSCGWAGWMAVRGDWRV